MSTPIVKRMVCLANSWKIGGRCIAALEIVDGRTTAWVRPVSHRPKGELLPNERCYVGLKEPAVGDIFTVQLLGRRDHEYQTENYLIDPSFRWTFEKKGTYNQLITCAVQHAGPIWTVGDSSSNGLNDRVTLDVAATIGESLKCIILPEMIVSVQNETWEGRTTKKIRGTFNYNGYQYRLSITDPQMRWIYSDQEEGKYREVDVVVCLSLSEPLNGHAYKLIAAVIRKDI